MSKIFTIAMDVDDICANLMDVWLKRYNEDYGDNLTEDAITDWDISKFVKPECGKDVYKYLSDPGLYNEIVPTIGAVEGIRELRRMNHKVIFVTSIVIASAGRKYFWLKEHHFKPDRDGYIEAYKANHKAFMHADFMFDDRYENIKNFTGIGILRTKPWNLKFSYPKRVREWNEFVDIIKEAM